MLSNEADLPAKQEAKKQEARFSGAHESPFGTFDTEAQTRQGTEEVDSE